MRPNNYSPFSMLFIVVDGFSVLCHCQFEPSRLRIVDKNKATPLFENKTESSIAVFCIA